MCSVCKRHNSPTKRFRNKTAEIQLESNDKSIRSLIDELVLGTQQLKALYTEGDEENARSS